MKSDVNPVPYTPVRIKWELPLLGASSVLASVGSCFAQEIAGKLFESGFRGAQNPNGILYNPVSITDCLSRIARDIPYTRDDFFEFNGKWCSWEHHGKFSDADLENAVAHVELSRKEFRKVLISADAVLITESSSVVYEHIEQKRIVANCHRVPNHLFRHRLLTHTETVSAIQKSIDLIRTVNLDCGIIFTLSPVRHYPGNLILNSRSKALLLSVIHEAVDANRNCAYFPSYEIMMDELRDYRFYADDMLHPAPLAQEIVLDRFMEYCFTGEAREKLRAAELSKRRGSHIEYGKDE